jgi:mannonate dehydratase
MVWNMRYRARRGDGVVGQIGPEELWQRLTWFLGEVLPIAEEADVVLAIHPEDPPMPSLRGIARILNPPENLLKLIDHFESPSHKVELCMGTVQEMPQGKLDAYQLLDLLVADDRVGYIHLRNVRGKVPRYQEVFLDEGDLDVPRVIELLHRRNYRGVIVPDHTPALECRDGWHAGMAYAIGYLRALRQAVEAGRLKL